MSFKLSPFFIEIKLLLSKNIMGFIEENQFEIKRKLQFEEMKVEKNRILFRDGFPVISLIISDNTVQVMSVVRNENEGLNSIFDALKTIGCDDRQKLTVTEYEKVSHLKFDNTDSINYFYLNTVEGLGELEDLTFDFTEIKENLKMHYYFRHTNKLNVASVSLLTAFIISFSFNDFIEKFSMYESIMDKNLLRVIKGKELPAYSQGRSKN